ncbi:MAG TPA: aspartyl protease family protein [Planctomycetota bacterium]
MHHRHRATSHLVLAVLSCLAACTGAPEVATERLQAELVRDGLIFVRGTIAGHEASMLLDTGAGATLVSAAFAERIGLRLEGGTTGTAVGVGGKVAATRIPDVVLTLGQTHTKAPVVVVPLDVAPFLGRDLEVVLGRDVFTSFVVEMDAGTSTVALHDRETFHYAGPGVTLPLQRGELDAWYVEARIEGLEPAWFELDTGDLGTLTVHEPFVARHSLLAGRPRGTALRGGVGGVIETVSTRIAEFTLGNLVFRDVPIETDRSDVGIFERTRAAGNLGTLLLTRCKIFVDGARSQIHLEPIAERMTAPFARNRSGLALAHRGIHLEVLHVAAGSPAAAAKLRIGDCIRAINGVEITKGYWERAWSWTAEPAGTRVTLELVGGERRSYTLGEVP